MPKPVLIYDDQCRFCGGLIDVIAALDKEHKLDYLGRDTEAGQKLRGELSLEPDTSGTVILISGSKHYIKSDALFQALRIIGGYWKVLSYFRFTPRFIRDRIYDLVAQNRYSIAGKSARQCPVRHDSHE